jgi:hypothetical protein
MPRGHHAIDRSGHRFGRLTIISQAATKQFAGGSRMSQWLCRCDCGKEKTIPWGDLRSGHTRSCGCLSIETTIKRSTKHGDAKHRAAAVEYNIRTAMISRCRNPKNKSYANYGGRGIRVCARWLHGDGCRSGYECFLADMGRRPSPLLSLDRIDNDGGYEPGNCRWTTAKEQRRNQRQ